VNIVRKPEHVDVLKKIGATYVCNSSSPTFMDDLTEALVATGATVAFDAIGGGRLAGQILTAMEIAANKTAKEYSRYGSTTHKQVYIYGGLDRGPTEFNRTFGMAWGSAAGCSPPSCRRLDSRPPRSCASGSRPRSRPRSPAPTRRRSRSPKR
jgi:NADPH2:quinone reductase